VVTAVTSVAHGSCVLLSSHRDVFYKYIHLFIYLFWTMATSSKEMKAAVEMQDFPRKVDSMVLFRV
jgi:hypothetical protein